MHTSKQTLLEIALLFFKLGCISFGGPAAHIAMMEDEVVKKRKWMTHQHFLDLVGATNLIPGPNSTELTMHCGHERAGWKGLFIAGISFIFPAVLITSVFAWLYSKYGELPSITPFIYGIKPAVLAIIIAATYTLGKKAIKNYELAILGILTFIACIIGVNEIVALFSCGVVSLFLHFFKKNNTHLLSFLPFLVIQTNNPLNVGNAKLFLIFLKIGAILYGSGYVLFAFLDAELVATGWLTRQVLIDAVAVGQMTPGPILSTATFIGWQMQGAIGALVATIGIFLPSFLFVWILNPLIPKMRKSTLFSNLLNAINVAAIALILAVCVEIGKEAITDWKNALIVLISCGIVFKLKNLNSAFIVIFGAVFGYLLSLI